MRKDIEKRLMDISCQELFRLRPSTSPQLIYLTKLSQRLRKFHSMYIVDAANRNTGILQLRNIQQAFLKACIECNLQNAADSGEKRSDTERERGANQAK
jgi:hypothetical protein